MQDIHDIVETSEQPDLLLWWQWALIGLGVTILLSILITLLSRKRKLAPARVGSPLQIALGQLKALDLDNTDANRLAVHLSLIIRQYLQRKFDDAALFETDEEFHARSAGFEKLPASATQRLQEYLTAISEHKYAPNPNHPAALQSLISKADQLIQHLDSAQAPTEASS